MNHYIGGIQRFSTEDGPGIRTTIFFKGCPLRCQWCHNPELLDGSYRILHKKEKCIACGQCLKVCQQGVFSLRDGKIALDLKKCKKCGVCIQKCCADALYTKSVQYSLDELMELIEQDSEFYKNSGGGITLSGGEVLADSTFAIKVAKAAVSRKISVAIETSGYGEYEALYELACQCDFILYDLKHMNEEKHRIYTGVSPKRIWDNLIQLSKHQELRDKIIIRIPFIHNVNDEIENIERVCKLMKKCGLRSVHLLPYHSMGISKAREIGMVQREFVTPSDDTLYKTERIFHANGIRAELLGKE